MTTLSSEARSERFNAFSLARPITVSAAFFIVVVILRSIGAFVLLLAERPNIIFSGVLGSLLVLVYIWLLRKSITSIGLHGRNFAKAFLVGTLSLLILYVSLYAVQFYRLSIAGEAPRLVFGVIDNETGALVGIFFTLFYLFGQLFNAFMEETIFRGVILPHFMLRFRFWKANVLQAFLFGLAHLVFPLVSWVNGQVTAAQAAAEAMSLVIFTTIGGLVFGYLYYRTGSLWTAVFAHLMDSVNGLFIHIQTESRLNAETDILMLASLGLIALVILVWIVSKRSNLPSLKPWGKE